MGGKKDEVKTEPVPHWTVFGVALCVLMTAWIAYRSTTVHERLREAERDLANTKAMYAEGATCEKAAERLRDIVLYAHGLSNCTVAVEREVTDEACAEHEKYKKDLERYRKESEAWAKKQGFEITPSGLWKSVSGR